MNHKSAPPRGGQKEPSLLGGVLRSIRQRFHLPEIRPDADALWRAVVCTVLMLLFALLQTTLFARFRPFGAIPDLMLPFVVAVGMAEGERWGAVFGIIAAFLIESLGAGGVSLLPLLYMPAGYFCPVVTKLYLTDSAPVRLIFTAVCGVGRAVMTLILLSLNVRDFSLLLLMKEVVLPEYAATFLFSVPVHLAVHAALRPFHKTRAERVTTL